MARIRRVQVPRRRRTPEVARVELLDAAERVFAHAHPDHVGLKEVAREARVSHALITHYFGTYGGLITAALTRRVEKVRDRIFQRLRVPGALETPEDLIDILFSALDDPVHLRLVKWLVAGEHADAAHAFALQNRGIQLVAAQIAQALDPVGSPSSPFRETVEVALLTAASAAYGYAVCKHALVGGLGREVTPELDRAVRKTLAGMIQTYVAAALPGATR